MPTRLIFIDDQQRRWHIRDIRIEQRGLKPRDVIIAVQFGDPLAHFRTFLLKEPPTQKWYRFRQGEQHSVDEPSLERQFIAADFVAKDGGTPDL
jgi:hypothetical protein